MTEASGPSRSRRIARLLVAPAATALLLGLGPSSASAAGPEDCTAAGGAPSCSGHKVLICAIPPGNPANAVTICVGQPAVEPIVVATGATLGACGGGT